MKTILKSFIFWFVLGNLASAQKPITIKETKILYKHGSIPGFMVTIPEVPTAKIEESWIKSIEKGTKSKVQKELGEMSIFGSIIKEVAGGPMNVYSYIKEIDSVNILAVSFELKKDEYITSEKRDYEFVKAKEYLFQFAQELYLDLAKDELQPEEKKLSKMESNLNSLENEKSRLDKMIQSNNSTIASTNVELVDLRTNLQSLKSELAAQTKELEAMNEGAGKDEKKKYIDDLEKRIKKTSNEIASGEKKVTSLNEEIEDAQKNKLPNNITEQGKLRKDITQQKEVVQIFTNKYNTIKAFKP
jgi:hypothetical protein